MIFRLFLTACRALSFDSEELQVLLKPLEVLNDFFKSTLAVEARSVSDRTTDFS